MPTEVFEREKLDHAVYQTLCGFLFVFLIRTHANYSFRGRIVLLLEFTHDEPDA